MSEAKAFLAVYVSVAISYLGVGLVAPLIAIVLLEHGADSVTVGLVGTTMFASFTLASFPMGNLTDRAGPKPVLIGGLLLYSVSILLFAHIDDVWLFFLVRAVEGIGGAAISVATETLVSHLSKPNERARRMSYYALSVGIGWAAGPLAGTLLFEVDPRFPFYACFVLGFMAALLAAAFVRNTDRSSHTIRKLSQILTWIMIVPVSAGALYGYLMSSLVTLFPLYLKQMSLEEHQMGIIITAVIVGTLISQVPIGRAADRFGKRTTLFVCAVVVSAIFAVMSLITDWRGFILTGALIGAFAGSFYPIGLSVIGGAVRRELLGAATSLFSLAFGVGSLTGPAVSGFAMRYLGSKWLLYLPAILAAAFAIELIFLYQRSSNRRNKSRPI